MNNFHLAYHYHAGTMPPPHHYRYSIAIGADSKGSVNFLPDYPGDGVPKWVREFVLEQAVMDQLIELLQQCARCEPKDPDGERTVGGALEWIRCTLNGTELTIDPHSTGSRIFLHLSRKIKESVPKAVWDELRSLHDEYQRNYPG